MDIHTYTPDNLPQQDEFEAINSFLFTHLDQYGDKKEDIAKAMNYSLAKNGKPGGFILSATDGDDIVGAVVVNETGMDGYIPDNILVYIAMHKNSRGKGWGKQMMQKAIETAKGDIALHVEPDNPAKFLYEKVGFTNKYLEMRLIKNK